MTLIAVKEWPDGHPFKNGIIGFVKRRTVSSENQSVAGSKTNRDVEGAGRRY